MKAVGWIMLLLLGSCIPKRWPRNKIDMSVFLLNTFLLLGLIVATVPDVMVLGSPGSSLIMDHEPMQKKCWYDKVYSMLQVRCIDMGLSVVPPELQTNIQVLDVSLNRMRELTNDSLARYTSLQYIYLRDNFLQSIQEGAFANQHYLEVVDLHKNGLQDVPDSLFRLPYLRNVYLGENTLTEFKHEIKSPLAFLELSKNKLTRMPQLEPLPSLTYLNVSGNAIATVSTEDLAPFCSLKILDLSRNPLKINVCDCYTLDSWLRSHQIEIKPAVLNCSDRAMIIGDKQTCPKNISEIRFSNRTIERYESCADVLRQREATEKARSTWIIIACCITAFLLCLFFSLYCVHRKNKRQQRKMKERQRLAANNANTELLNSNLQSENT